MQAPDTLKSWMFSGQGCGIKGLQTEWTSSLSGMETAYLRADVYAGAQILQAFSISKSHV